MLGIGAFFLAEKFQGGVALGGCLGTGTEGICTREGLPF